MKQDEIINPGYSDECEGCNLNCQQCPVFWDANNIDPEEGYEDFINSYKNKGE